MCNAGFGLRKPGMRGLHYLCLARLGCTDGALAKTFLLKLYRYIDAQGREVLGPESAALALSGYLA